MNKLLKADLHVHTEYSMDCNTSLEKIISRCLEIGINCIAIADHGTAEGALKLQSMAPFPVIVAEEILTPHGEIMGMFLKETIPTRIPVEEAVSRIKSQGGLVCIPHPFGFLRHSALDIKTAKRIVGQTDVIEVFNSRAFSHHDSTRAQLFAQKYNIPGSAGSDAHTIGEIGSAYVEMPEFNGRDDFLQALARGSICGHLTSPLVHFSSISQRLKSRFK